MIETEEKLASLVQRLRAESAKQREQRGDLMTYGTPDPWLVEAADTIASLLSELATMREALEAIQFHACNHGGWVENDAWGGVCEIHKLASAALPATLSEMETVARAALSTHASRESIDGSA